MDIIIDMIPDSGLRLSSGAVVFRRESDRTLFLLLRAFSHWDFPKGMVEPGEAPIDAAVREVMEETTLDDLRFEWGAEFIETGPYSRGKIARYYLARTERENVSLPINPEIGRAEHVEYRWVNCQRALQLTSPRVHPVIEWASAILKLE